MNPAIWDNIFALTDEITENAPLILHAHGTKADFFPFSWPRPKGKKKPRKIATGAEITKEITIRKGNEAKLKKWISEGRINII